MPPLPVIFTCSRTYYHIDIALIQTLALVDKATLVVTIIHAIHIAVLTPNDTSPFGGPASPEVASIWRRRQLRVLCLESALATIPEAPLVEPLLELCNRLQVGDAHLVE